MNIIRLGDGSRESRDAEVVGAKAANLAHMADLGLPVPPAFVLPVDLCAAIVGREPFARQALADCLKDGAAFLEQATGKRLGGDRRPLLVSVRSGAARSMPGMLDTVLDVGCTAAAVHGLVRMTGHPRFAWDCRRRFLESYATVVLGADPKLLASAAARLLGVEGAESVQMLDSAAIEDLARAYEEVLDDEGYTVPDDPMEQLDAAAQAVYRSWTGERACTYRRLQHLEDLRGTAVTVQAMVFGNRGRSSGAGVAFSRDPSSGVARPVIDVLFESQGEDVVSGSRSPQTEDVIARTLPAVAGRLHDVLAELEREFRDVQDVEFTIEDGKLWILQTRSAKRTPQAALRFAIDLVNDGLIDPPEALQRLNGVDLSALARQKLANAPDAVAHGTPASAGIGVGRAIFDSTGAAQLASAGDPVILIRPDTSTADVAGFNVATGIVTAVGGRTAHAALVARQMGKPCVVGCAALKIDDAAGRAILPGTVINEGDWLSIDGETGAIYLGRCEVATTRPDAELAQIERWRHVPARASA